MEKYGILTSSGFVPRLTTLLSLSQEFVSGQSVALASKDDRKPGYFWIQKIPAKTRNAL